MKPFEFYRYEPQSQSNPRLDTHKVDLNECENVEGQCQNAIGDVKVSYKKSSHIHGRMSKNGAKIA